MRRKRRNHNLLGLPESSRYLSIEKLSTNVPGFKAVVIELQSDEESDEIVSKPPLRGLRTPEFGRIEGEDGKPVAYYWACLNQENKRLGPENLILEKTDSCDPSQYRKRSEFPS
jgi:hypothetical protein